jgi:hypothetical protein
MTFPCSTQHAAKLLGVAHITLQKHIAKGICAAPTTKVSKGYLWYEQDIRRWNKYFAATPKPGRKKKRKK